MVTRLYSFLTQMLSFSHLSHRLYAYLCLDSAQHVQFFALYEPQSYTACCSGVINLFTNQNIHHYIANM